MACSSFDFLDNYFNPKPLMKSKPSKTPERQFSRNDHANNGGQPAFWASPTTSKALQSIFFNPGTLLMTYE